MKNSVPKSPKIFLCQIQLNIRAFHLWAVEFFCPIPNRYKRAGGSAFYQLRHAYGLPFALSDSNFHNQNRIWGVFPKYAVLCFILKPDYSNCIRPVFNAFSVVWGSFSFMVEKTAWSAWKILKTKGREVMSKFRNPVLVKSAKGWELLYTYGTYFYIRKEGNIHMFKYIFMMIWSFLKFARWPLKMFVSFVDAMVNWFILFLVSPSVLSVELEQGAFCVFVGKL
jgi:hypothetical protein